MYLFRKLNPFLQKELQQAIVTQDFARMCEVIEAGARVRKAEIELAGSTCNEGVIHYCKLAMQTHKSIEENVMEWTSSRLDLVMDFLKEPCTGQKLDNYFSLNNQHVIQEKAIGLYKSFPVYNEHPNTLVPALTDEEILSLTSGF